MCIRDRYRKWNPPLLKTRLRVLFATGVIIVETGGRPNHKKWLMGAQVCTYKEAQLMGAQGGV